MRRYQFVHDHRKRFAVRLLCQVTKVAVSGYYAWRDRAPSQHEHDNAELVRRIKKIHNKSRRTYGSPRICKEIQKEGGITCGRHRIARLMRQNRIRSETKRSYRVTTTNSDHRLPVAHNVLDRSFSAAAPNLRWASDTTYIKTTTQGWLYLAIVMDLHSRRIVGWSMQASQEQKLVSGALEMALQARKPEQGLLHHSDRGSTYASWAYQKQLQDAGAISSMSRTGNCWDNAVVESFFATLKAECFLEQNPYPNHAAAKAAIFEFIEVWYNKQRCHSTLGYLSPAEFERQHSMHQA